MAIEYIYIIIYIYNDLTATSLESWLVRGIITKWPNYSGCLLAGHGPGETEEEWPNYSG